MSETVTVKKEDKSGAELAEFELELPTDFDELEILPGKEKSLTMVRNQMKIEARAKKDPRRAAKGERKPRGVKAEVAKGLKEGDFTEADLIEFIKAKRAQKEAA